MSSLSKIILPSIIFGISWAISVNHSYIGFCFLVFFGFLLGFFYIISDYFLEVIKGIAITILIGFISAIPIVGQLFAIIILLYFAIKNLTELIKNLPLIILGFGVYYSLLFGPKYLNNVFQQFYNYETSLIDFLIGSLMFYLLSLLLMALGVEIKKIFIFTIGLPAFIFIFYISRQNSPFKNM